MLNLTISVTNPWSSRFENIKCWTGKTFIKNKRWEFELLKTTDILLLSFALTTKQDHAGLEIEIGLFGFQARFNVYDCRHWENGAWAKPNGRVVVKFYKEINEKLVVVRTEECYNIFEAEQLVDEEKHQYVHTEFVFQD
jgi:hypothetical protein